MKKREKCDLRTQKTFDALIEAMRQLLSEKDFDKITVRELCDRARTRTATFYNHFSDKYDFVAFMVREEHARKFHLPDAGAPDGEGEFFSALVRSSYDYVDQNAKLMVSLRSNDFLKSIVQSSSADLVEEIRTHIEHEGTACEAAPELAAQATIGVISQCTSWWLDHREAVPKESAVEQTTALVRAMVG